MKNDARAIFIFTSFCIGVLKTKGSENINDYK